jgi:hypothetical protein
VRAGLSSATPPPMGHVDLSTFPFTFAPQVVGTTSFSQEVIITSTGTGPAAITSMVVSDGFSVAHDCPAAIAPGASCVATLRFVPTTVGPHTGAVTITAEHRIFSIGLTGNAVIATTLLASSPTVTAGAPVTLTWTTSLPTSICSASGGVTGDGWQGPITAGGSRVVTRPDAGIESYSVTCSENNVTASANVSVTYTMPTVTLTPGLTNVNQGQPHTLMWSSTNADTCTASGNGTPSVWSGAKPTAGSASISETTVGLITYTLTCSSTPQSVQASVQVFVNAPPPAATPPANGGGGAMGLGSLLAFMGLCALRVTRARRPNERP